ncbi:MAG: hypothetical protein AABW73_00695 [Nanoarchaeota archaeon]
MRVDYKEVLYAAAAFRPVVNAAEVANNQVEGRYRSGVLNHHKSRMLTRELERRERGVVALASDLGVLEAEEIVFDECKPIGKINEENYEGSNQ